MLQTDPDDQYLTESALNEINHALPLKYFAGLQEMIEYARGNGGPSLILLSDVGTITERGQVLRQLKSDHALNHIPVVVLGERSSPDYVKECYRAGASTFITKPSSVSGTKKKIDMFFAYWSEVAEL
jgi:CheY-like chemotaxis protein